ncbi:MAG: DNA polymerase III subunit delta [Candidatus Margulisiibacteriota bacterium]
MGTSSNIFCFYGPEDFLAEEEISSLRNSIEKSCGTRPDIEYFSPDNISASDLVSGLCTSSLFGGSRIAVMEGFDDEDLLEVLSKRKNFPGSVSLVIKADKIDKRGKLYKLLSAEATVKEFKPFAEWETKKIIDWILAKTKAAGKTISPSAAELLNDVSGPSLRQLACEIEKLSTYAADRASIEPEDIRALAVSGDLGAFALENAFASRDLKAALISLDGAFRAKQPAHVLIGRLASRLRPYLTIKALNVKKVPAGDIIRLLGMNPYFYERCSEGAALYSLEELLTAFETLSRADIAVKNSSAPPRIAMELALIDIMVGK